MLIDSHCHLDKLDLTKYGGDLAGALAAAKNNAVKHMLCVCIDLDHFDDVIAIATQYDHVQATVGLHPSETVDKEPCAEQLSILADHPKVVGIGETGLDYYHCKGDVTWQKERFRTHIQAAKKVQKPLIIHTRQAQQDTISIMKEEGAQQVRGVMHCFTESWEMAKQAMDLGFYISFSGIVTFDNAKELKELAKKIPLDRMLIETDAPFLAPIPHRGKPNEPAYVRYIAEHIAQLRNIEFTTVAQWTTQNYFTLFGE